MAHSFLGILAAVKNVQINVSHKPIQPLPDSWPVAVAAISSSSSL